MTVLWQLSAQVTAAQHGVLQVIFCAKPNTTRILSRALSRDYEEMAHREIYLRNNYSVVLSLFSAGTPFSKRRAGECPGGCLTGCGDLRPAAGRLIHLGGQ
jgi:hypothetical protein